MVELVKLVIKVITGGVGVTGGVGKTGGTLGVGVNRSQVLISGW